MPFQTPYFWRRNQERGIHFRHCLLPIAFCVFALSGCNQTFEPFKENDRYNFSISGCLDASADTQWVRVAPARQQLNAPPEVPEMLVTLEHVESGETVVMKDSLFGVGSGVNYISIEDVEYFLDGTASNIENGLGYLVGVYSKVVPYETCTDSSGWITACEEEEPFW